MTSRLQQPTSADAIYKLPTVIDLHDPVSVPGDTDLDNPAAIEHAAPAEEVEQTNQEADSIRRGVLNNYILFWTSLLNISK